MSDFREELIEAMARAYYVWACCNGDESLYDEPGSHQAFARARAEVMLDAALAFRQTVECPECGGRACCVITHGADDYEDVPCRRCIDGRVPTDTRLAIVERQVGLAFFDDDEGEWQFTEALELVDMAVGRNDDGSYEPWGRPVFLLAPDLPEGTPEP